MSQRSNAPNQFSTKVEITDDLMQHSTDSNAVTDWSNFDAAYRRACETSEPSDWMKASLMAQQVRNGCDLKPVAPPSAVCVVVPPQEYSLYKALRMLTNGSAYDLTDSPRSFVGNVRRLLDEFEAAAVAPTPKGERATLRNTAEKEFAVFVLVRVKASTKAQAEEMADAVLANAVREDNTGLNPPGRFTGYELRDTVAAD